MTADEGEQADDTGDIRERAQSLREELADSVDAPAEQDDHAAARKRADGDEE